MKLIIIGEKQTKRNEYMTRAANGLGVCCETMQWDSLHNEEAIARLKGAVVKLDPPSFSTVYLSKMRQKLSAYREALQMLKQAHCRFLNAPDAIWMLLDKKTTKARLMEQGLCVTQMFFEEVDNTEQLLDLMRKKRCYSVFIKPRYFSGAAGVAAVRAHPARHSMTLDASCYLENGELINSKRLFHLTDNAQIHLLLDKLLSLDCVVERWHPKADCFGKSYDLRAVFQFGGLAHIVVRQSNGPITNLHLNNQALPVSKLGLPGPIMQAVEELCREAVALFSGLHMAGVDILLDKGSLRPRIIEMNGQGDLIYQDIFAENNIYREQVIKLCKQSI